MSFYITNSLSLLTKFVSGSIFIRVKFVGITRTLRFLPPALFPLNSTIKKLCSLETILNSLLLTFKLRKQFVEMFPSCLMGILERSRLNYLQKVDSGISPVKKC